MPRPLEGRERIVAKLKPEDREKLGNRVIELGFAHKYKGVLLPNWTEFVEAIAKGDIILCKKLE
ncbi:MAG TPA: hypothetical protein V6D19_05510 [Stenomitos sp.]